MKGTNFRYIVVVWNEYAPDDEYETTKGFNDLSSALDYMDLIHLESGVMVSLYETKLTFWQ